MSNVEKNTTDSNTLNEVKSFRKAYGMLPAARQLEFRDNLMSLCDWKTYKTFHQKRKGEVKITKLESPVILDAFADYNINAITGEYIKSFAV